MADSQGLLSGCEGMESFSVEDFLIWLLIFPPFKASFEKMKMELSLLEPLLKSVCPKHTTQPLLICLSTIYLLFLVGSFTNASKIPLSPDGIDLFFMEGTIPAVYKEPRKRDPEFSFGYHKWQFSNFTLLSFKKFSQPALMNQIIS